MFSPAARKSHRAPPSHYHHHQQQPGSPSTPLPNSRVSQSAVPDRPTTGTPAPWASRLSVLARIPSQKKADNASATDQTQPVFVGEFPQVVRNAQDSILQRNITDQPSFSGGLDKGTSLSWLICGNQLFVWHYLSTTVSKSCVVLDIPAAAMDKMDANVKYGDAKYWLVNVIRWDNASSSSDILLKRRHPTGIIISNQKTQAVVYWPDMISEDGCSPIVSLPDSEFMNNVSRGKGATFSKQDREDSWGGYGDLPEYEHFSSMVASALPHKPYECVAIAAQSNGILWHFHLTPSAICRVKIFEDAIDGNNLSYPQINKGFTRTVIWRVQDALREVSAREFLLLTDREIQCWNIELAPYAKVKKLWTHEIVGSDNDLGIKKDLAGQKHIWLLDMQVDDRGKFFIILVAILCKDRASSSSYIQYSLLTMQYRTGQSFSDETRYLSENVLEKKAPLQVIIPKARVEDERYLFSMRLRVGGKPSGSAIILSGDGTATITNYWRGSTRLYQFDLPWDAGKVLDASVLPSPEDNDGAWVVLTEKAGLWAIPEKAVLLGGAEPPERSLSRGGSLKEGAAEEEKRNLAFAGSMIPRRATSEAWSVGDQQRPAFASFGQRTAQDEEAEALLGRLFHDFCLSGQVEGVLEKLRNKGAFEKEGETNVFARVSKSIVDTLAKHWTTTRGAEFVASTVISTLLSDKRQKHQKYLQFLSLSKCHEELSSKQRQSLLIIMENGEKLSGLIRLRELQNLLCQNQPHGHLPSSQSKTLVSGSLWGLIQLVGDKARQNTVLLMDRDNAEVFYSRVSDVEELFDCLSHHLHDIIGRDESSLIQMQRAYELSNAITSLIQAALGYRSENHAWYPSPEGLTPWNCYPIVRSGLWRMASYILQLLKEITVLDISLRADLCFQLELLTDILLEAYTASITAKSERGEEFRGLLDEYCHRRDELLGSLYFQTKVIADARYQESCKGVEDVELKRATHREATTSILSIAKRHEGYQTLWQICNDLGDPELLRILMHDSRGPRGGFCYFVFKQLIKCNQHAKLLRLGEEFQEQLANFLKDEKSLLWLHEIFLNQFSSASETLHALALSHDDGSLLANDAEYVSIQSKHQPSLAERRRILCLAKISAAAGRDVGFETKIKRLEADLQILHLQEEIVRCSPGIQGHLDDINKPLPPRDLIEMCLRGNDRGLSLVAFEIFAWTSSSFRERNRSLLEECWRNAADQDDWVALCQRSTAEGWSDEVKLENLKETILFKASKLCYGSDEAACDGDFEEVLPLQNQEPELVILRDQAGSSVEVVLMQHKDFPDAGKLMLIAVMMGKQGTHAIAEESVDIEC